MGFQFEEKMIKDAEFFLKMAFTQLDQVQFEVSDHWHIDHLCYRTSTDEKYQFIKNEFLKFSKLLIESKVNGRLISTFKLSNPIQMNNWQVDLIEITAPKKGKTAVDGFEHFEIVCDLTFDEIKNRYALHHFDESGLAKDFNQELKISFPGFAIKFHHLSLESVINVEKNLSVSSALINSDILKILKPFSPLIAGTFPLNVNVAGSDVDILISTDDFDLVKKILTKKFGGSTGFKCTEMLIKDDQTLLISFSYQGIDFEIFGQQNPSVKQQGYLHFLIEERLLKIGGKSLADQIIKFRQQGLKTEPAFAKVLGLKGDPFAELLKLQRLSNKEIKEKLNQIQFKS